MLHITYIIYVSYIIYLTHTPMPAVHSYVCPPDTHTPTHTHTAPGACVHTAADTSLHSTYRSVQGTLQVLCYAMLCCPVLCYAMLYYAVLCCDVLCYAMQCYVVLCCAMLCYAVLCCAML
jgi:hypothetical protein